MSDIATDQTQDTEVILLDEKTDSATLETRYEFGVVTKASPEAAAAAAVIQKASQQQNERKSAARRWAEPRMSFESLLYFYEVNTYLRRAINLKARVVAGLGWELVTDEDEKDPDDVHAKITAVLGGERLRKTLERWMIDKYSVGNGFLEVERDGSGEPAAIYHARACSMRRDTKLNAEPTDDLYHQVRRGKVVATFAAFGADERDGQNEVIHIDDYDPYSDYYGAPTWLGAMGTMLLDRTTVEHATYLFKNGLMANFVVVVEGGKLPATQVDTLKKFIKQNATGIENAGRGLVLQNEKDGVKIRVEKLNVDIKDLKLESFREGYRDEVVSSAGVPPRLLGIVQAGQLGGGGETEGQLKIFVETEVRPEQEAVEERMNEVLAAFGEHKWRFQLKGLDITDVKADAAYYTAALNPQTGWMSQDEVREEQGRKPIEADEPEPVDVEKSAKQLAPLLSQLRKALDSAAIGDGSGTIREACC